MNFYIDIINKTVNYIEDKIEDRLSLSDISSYFGISDFHFNRMFKTVSGITLKQYILGRKLSKAAEKLKSTHNSVIDIAFSLGFEYPEVFSRSFKKQFGVSPVQCRQNNIVVQDIPKISIVERKIINYKGTMVLKGNSIFLEELSLKGIFIEADKNAVNFKENLKSKADSFIEVSSNMDSMSGSEFYTVVNCHGNDNGEYTVFCGRQWEKSSCIMPFDERIVPEGWYVNFMYNGDVYDIQDVFIDDLYRWIIVKEAKLNPNGVGMVNIYKNDYPENHRFRILIPLKEPV